MAAGQARSRWSQKRTGNRKTGEGNHGRGQLGGADLAGNARLAAVVEKARKQSVSRDVIERAIKKGAGIGGEKLELEQIVFEGYGPHKVPVIVEVQTDNKNRTAPEIRVLFKRGQLGAPGSNKFRFDHVGLVEAHHSDVNTDAEAAAIEAGAQDFVPLQMSRSRFPKEPPARASSPRRPTSTPFPSG
jgi:transcriptional/translational regulatory protein YebC/TACO1